MICAVCSNCGYSIDVFEEDKLSPVREKRLKYLLTRDQVCPNCLMSISRCERIEAEESDLPLFKIDVDEAQRAALKDFGKKRGYGAVTEYALKEFKVGKK
jgi:hypothetical protein